MDQPKRGAGVPWSPVPSATRVVTVITSIAIGGADTSQPSPVLPEAERHPHSRQLTSPALESSVRRWGFFRTVAIHLLLERFAVVYPGTDAIFMKSGRFPYYPSVRCGPGRTTGRRRQPHAGQDPGGYAGERRITVVQRRQPDARACSLDAHDHHPEQIVGRKGLLGSSMTMAVTSRIRQTGWRGVRYARDRDGSARLCRLRCAFPEPSSASVRHVRYEAYSGTRSKQLHRPLFAQS